MAESTFEIYYAKYEEIIRKRPISKNDERVGKFLDFLKDLADSAYMRIHELDDSHLYNRDSEKEIRQICTKVISKIYPYFNNRYFIELTGKVDKEIQELLNYVEDRLYRVMAFRSIKYFALYLERGNSKKIWRDTIDIFENFFYYSNRMVLQGDMEQIRASYFPGAGKTYAGNILCAYWFGYDWEMSILRATYSEELAKTFTNQIVNIIRSDEYRNVFPRFNLAEKDLWKVNNVGGFQFKFSNFQNFFSTTVNGQITGKRAKALMIDDPTKGAKDAANIKLYQDLIRQYDFDWSSRTDDGKQFQIFLGTMWSSYDLLNVIYERALKEGQMSEDTNFKYTMVNNKDVRFVTKAFISTPALDYSTDETTCPKRYSTEYFRKIRDNAQDKSLFSAVYQQKPEEPDNVLFGWNRLRTYSSKNPIPFNVNVDVYETRAMLDPARKAKNYVAFGIFRRFKKKDNTWSKWYLIDCLYEMETMGVMYPKIAKKIVQYGIEKVSVEINTETSAVWIMKTHLKNLHYTEKVKFSEVYTNENKEDKIANARVGIKEEIVYPAREEYSTLSPMGMGMSHLTTWDISGKNAYDDFPDMVCMFVNDNCGDDFFINETIVLDRSLAF